MNRLIFWIIVAVVLIIIWDEHAYAQWKFDNPGWVFSSELISQYAPPPGPPHIRSENYLPDDFRSPYWRFR